MINSRELVAKCSRRTALPGLSVSQLEVVVSIAVTETQDLQCLDPAKPSKHSLRGYEGKHISQQSWPGGTFWSR
jgi:hypothetical protein